jgi:hypothetical protein
MEQLFEFDEEINFEAQNSGRGGSHDLGGGVRAAFFRQTQFFPT